nr:hypothetical protein [Tanacetum cinerariifolium]GEW35865.1 hypothetical protein [Tanacetum cinerariifolium]
MDDPNVTMQEYIRLEEEKAQRHGRTFNWQTATYRKVKYYKDEDDCFTNFETEFSVIVFDDTLTTEATLSCEHTVSVLNENEIDFRTSFDKSDDEHSMVIFDDNLFSYIIIYVDNFKTDSKNDNVKVNMPSFPLLEPTVSYFDDLDHFKYFENEFPAIVCNDALTFKLNFLTEPTVNLHRIDKLGLKNETLLSECDEEELNILYFNDLIPLNVIYPNDVKSDKDNDDDDEIDLIQSLGDNVINIKRIYVPIGIPFDPKRYYKDSVYTRILRRPRGHAPKKVNGIDLFYLTSMDRETANVPYLLSQYLFRHVEGRKSGARLSKGHFIRHLAAHFGLVSDEGLRGLSVIVRLHGDVNRSITDQFRFTTWMVSWITLLMDASGRTFQAFESTLVGPCSNKIDELVMAYSGKRRVLNSYGHSDASSTHFRLRTQTEESS